MTEEGKGATFGTALATALLTAQRSIQAVVRGDEGTTAGMRKYKYTGTESMIRECRVALHNAGIVVVRLGRPIVAHDMPNPVVESTFRVMHADSGEFMDCGSAMPACERKGVPPDKATAAACTFDYGYFLRDLLMVPRVDKAAEVDAQDDSGHEPQVAEKPWQAVNNLRTRMALEPEAVTMAAESAGVTTPAKDWSWPESGRIMSELKKLNAGSQLASNFVDTEPVMVDEPKLPPSATLETPPPDTDLEAAKIMAGAFGLDPIVVDALAPRTKGNKIRNKWSKADRSRVEKELNRLADENKQDDLPENFGAKEELMSQEELMEMADDFWGPPRAEVEKRLEKILGETWPSEWTEEECRLVQRELEQGE